MGLALVGQMGRAPTFHGEPGIGAFLVGLGFGVQRGLGVLADRRDVAKHAGHGYRNTTSLLGLCQMRPYSTRRQPGGRQTFGV